MMKSWVRNKVIKEEEVLEEHNDNIATLAMHI